MLTILLIDEQQIPPVSLRSRVGMTNFSGGVASLNTISDICNIEEKNKE
ncbi:MAG: hypothetical protein WAN65_29965 [Candidatus Sulfotelmatobacter sp.]